MTLPIIVVLALLIGHVIGAGPSSQPSSTHPAALPPLTPSAPPSRAAATRPCIKVLQTLPRQLATLQPRVVHPDPPSPYVVAWGDPAVVLRCGVPRPAALVPDSSARLTGVNGVFWLVDRGKTDTNWIAVDRAAYVEVTVPNSYHQPPIAPLADAIAKALPAVCLPGAALGQSPPPTDKLCTRRK